MFYGLGFAHAEKKRVILMKEQSPGATLDLPFDIKDFRTQSYEFTPNGLVDLKERLKNVLLSEIATSSR